MYKLIVTHPDIVHTREYSHASTATDKLVIAFNYYTSLGEKVKIELFDNKGISIFDITTKSKTNEKQND